MRLCVYRQLLEDIILGIEQGLVVRDGMSVAALDGLEERMNSIEASPAAAAPAVGTKQQRRGRSLAGLLPDSTSAAKPMGLQAALTRAAALASAYYPPEVGGGYWLVGLGNYHMVAADPLACKASGSCSRSLLIKPGPAAATAQSYLHRCTAASTWPRWSRTAQITSMTWTQLPAARAAAAAPAPASL